MTQANVPVRESVGAALRFVRENWRFVAIVAASGAVATGAVMAFGLAAPQLNLITLLITALVQTFTYAAFLCAALFGADAVRPRWARDGGRVWGAMAIIGFFLFIVLFIASMPVAIVLASGPLQPYLPELQAAGNDQAAVMNIMTRFAEENPNALLAVTCFYGIIWVLLTSRLYVAAPASVDRGRVLSFETWKWTKGAMLRVTAARALLLVPANIFTFAVAHLIGLAFGVNSFAGADPSNPVTFVAFTVVSAFITFGLYSALEAGLSTYLYKGLAPAEPKPAVHGSTDSANLG